MKPLLKFAIAAALLSTLITWIGAQMRFDTVRVPLVDEAISAFEDKALSGSGVERVLRPAYSRIILVNLLAEDVASNRAAPVREANRIAIADLFDALREAPHAPAAVILDIDIAPPAYDFANGASTSESRLAQSITDWAADERAAPLLLARGEDCRLPPGGEDSGQLRLWRSTPYDVVANPRMPAGKVAWTCPIPVVWKDGLVRGLEPLACGSQNLDGTGRFPVPGPSTWIQALDRGETSFHNAVQRNLGAWQSVCAGPPMLPYSLPLPIVASEGWTERQTEVAWPATGAALGTLPDLSGALVVIGQKSVRAGDRWKIPAIGRMPGYEMIAANVATNVAAKGRFTLNAVTSSLLGAFLGFTLAAAYFLVRVGRKRLSDALTTRFGGSAGFLARLLLAPPVIVGCISIGILLVLPFPMLRLFNPQSWVYLYCAVAGASIALMLSDFAMQEDPAKKPGP